MTERAQRSKSAEKASDSAGTAEATPTFEVALEQLERVVVRLEKGELSLEESLSAYEDGVRLVHAARTRLDGMQSRLEQLLHDGKTAPLARASDRKKSPETNAAKNETPSSEEPA